MKKTISKIIVSCFILCLVVGGGVLLSACNEHKHSFSNWQVVTQATCENDGLEQRTCECGETETKIIPAVGHDYGEWVFDKDRHVHTRICKNNSSHSQTQNCSGKTTTQNPSCEEKGLSTFTCTICGGVDETVLPKLGHVHSGLAKSNGNGTHSYHCTRCNQEIINEPCHGTTYFPVDSVSHRFVCDECEGEVEEGCSEQIEYVPPTCEENGYTRIYCPYCLAETRTVHEKTGHNWGAMQFDEQRHKHVQQCMNSNCDKTLEGDCVFDHVTVDADCETNGVTHYSCTICHGSYDEIIPAKGHDYQSSPWQQGENDTHFRVCKNAPNDASHNEVKECQYDIVENDSTCTQEGSLTKTCPDCNRIISSTIEKKPHEYGVWSPLQKSEGYFHHHTCAICFHDEEEPCTFEEGKTVEATCLEQGYTEKICSDCGFMFRDNIVAATGHNFGQWQYNDTEHFHICENNGCQMRESHPHSNTSSVTDATCLTDGQEVIECSTCHRQVTNVIPAKGHSWGPWEIDDDHHVRDCQVEDCPGHEEGAHTFGFSNLCDACEYDGLTYENEEDGVFVKNDSRLSTSIKKLVIPSLHNGKTVHGIGAMAFQFQTYLLEVEIAEGIIYIGDSAFGGCSKLATVLLPNSLKNLGSNAFIGCRNLANITLPDQLESIGTAAFSGTKLIEDSTNWENATNGGKVFYIGKFLIKAQNVENEYEIKEGTTFIDEEAFENCSNLTTIILPASLSRVGKNAFEGCSSLSAVKFKGTVNQWFAIQFVSHSSNPLYVNDNCTLHIDSAEGKIEIPQESNVQAIPAGTFRNDTEIQSITIPNTVKTIGARAFEGCTSLSSIIIPESVTHIYANAFKGCSALATVTVLGKVIIEENAFEGTKILNDFLSGSGIYAQMDVLYLGKNLLKAKPSIQQCVIQADTYSIAPNAFENCINLESITINDELEFIGRYAFKNCSALKTANFGNNTQGWLGEEFKPNGVSILRGVLSSSLSNSSSAATCLVYTYAGYWTKKLML